MVCDDDDCRAKLWSLDDCSIQPGANCDSDALFIQGFLWQVLCFSYGDKASAGSTACQGITMGMGLLVNLGWGFPC